MHSWPSQSFSHVSPASVTFAALLASRSEMALHPKNTHTRTRHKKQAVVEPELWNSCESLAGLHPRVAETFHPPAGTIVSLARRDRSRPTLKRVAGGAVEPQRSQRRGMEVDVRNAE